MAVRLALASLAAVAGPAAWAADPAPITTSTTTAQTVTGTTPDATTLTVTSSGSVNVNGSTALTISGTAGIVNINNSGVISNTSATGRAIDNNTNGVTINLTNTGTISSSLGDAFRINKANSVIHLINLGTIISSGTMPSTGGVVDVSNSGQALDFKSVTSTGNTIQNGDATHTNALIQSNSDDALRPGSNTLITNYGTIITNSPVNTKDTTGNANAAGAADGIDAGAATGVVVNNFGTISGSRHGITADTNITVTNGSTTNSTATIIGRNGSGVGSDGIGTVVNYGLISGDYAGAGNVFSANDPTSLNGDGDGVDIDGMATITNYGTIRGTGAGGVDSGGLPNGSEGVAAGGGTIINGSTTYTKALISGAGIGILIDNGSSGPGVGITNISNYGTIEGKTKAAIGMVGSFADTITNYSTGVIKGGTSAVTVDSVGSTTAGAAIQMGAGNDVLNNYGTIIGANGLAVDMGADDDTVNIYGGSITGKVDGGTGSNTLNFQGSFTGTGDYVNFATTNVNSGTVRMMGNLQSGTISVANGATLVMDNSFSTGTLNVNGTLGLSGTNSARTMTITGNYNQAATGVVNIGILSATSADVINVAGTATIANGATFKFSLLGTGYTPSGTMTFLTAGTLAADASQLKVINTASLNFVLSQVGNNLLVAANRTPYGSNSSNGDAGSVGGALNSIGANGGGSAGTAMGGLLSALDNLPTGGAVSGALNQLAPTSGAVLQGGSNNLQTGFFNAVGDHMSLARAGGDTGASAGDGNGRRAWIRLFGNQAHQEARGGVDGFKATTGGLAGGIDKDIDPQTLVGFAFGAANSDVNRTGGLSGSGVDIDSLQLSLYGTRNYGAYYLEGNLGYGYNRYRSTRSIGFSGFGGFARSDFHGNQFSARFGGGLITPFNDSLAMRWLGSLQATYLRTDSYSETGAGAANLNISSGSGTSVLSSLGGQLEKTFSGANTTYTAYARALWNHEFGQTMQTSASFAAGGPSFTTSGLTQARDAAILGIGISGTDKKGFTLSAGYDAEIRQQYTGHTIQVKAQWLF